MIHLLYDLKFESSLLGNGNVGSFQEKRVNGNNSGLLIHVGTYYNVI